MAALKQTEEILNKTKSDNQGLEETVSELKKCFDQERTHFVNQFEELEREKSKADSSLAESEHKICELQGDLERKTSESNVKIKELQEELETSVADSEHKITELQGDVDRQTSESDAKIKKLQGQLDTNRSELEQLQNKLGDLVYEKSQLHMEIGHMEAKVKLLNCESEKTREDAEKAFKVIPQLKEEINALLIEKKNAEDQIVELIAQNSNLQGTLEVFQSDFDVYVESTEKDKSVMNHKIVELTEEVDGLKEQKDQMAKELDEWLTEKSELDIDMAKLQCRIKGM